MNIEQLLQAVQNGDVKIQDLTPEQSEAVLEGYKQVAEHLLEDESTRVVGEAILQVIGVALEDDPFEVAIQAAEECGSTYWELETNSIH